MLSLPLFAACAAGVFIVCLLIQLVRSLFIHLKLALLPLDRPLATPAFKPLTVIVYSRNALDDLKILLPLLEVQDYPLYEVVVVDDRSWDGTADFLRAFTKTTQRIRVVTVNEGDKFIAGKKFALSMGIKAAAYDWLVFTDAHCVPASPAWLKGMQAPAEAETEILLGHFAYDKGKGWLNLMLRLDAFFDALAYLSAALRGRPYKGDGRNLAYKKSLFFNGKGFAAHMHLAAGEASLFVHQHARKGNTKIRIHPDTQVWTHAEPTLISYIRENKKRNKAEKSFRRSYGLGRICYRILTGLFWVSGILLLCFPETRYLTMAVIAGYALVRTLVYAPLFNRLHYSGLKWWLPLLDLMRIFFILFVAIVTIFVKPLPRNTY